MLYIYIYMCVFPFNMIVYIRVTTVHVSETGVIMIIPWAWNMEIIYMYRWTHTA